MENRFKPDYLFKNKVTEKETEISDIPQTLIKTDKDFKNIRQQSKEAEETGKELKEEKITITTSIKAIILILVVSLVFYLCDFPLSFVLFFTSIGFLVMALMFKKNKKR